MAAIIMAYYPELSAAQVKEVIVKSAVKMDLEVNLPGASEEDDMVKFKDLSKTGGLLNAYEAVLLAEKMTKKLPVSIPTKVGTSKTA